MEDSQAPNSLCRSDVRKPYDVWSALKQAGSGVFPANLVIVVVELLGTFAVCRRASLSTLGRMVPDPRVSLPAISALLSSEEK